MTRSANARVAGFSFLAYIALAFPAMLLFSRATDAEGVPARLTRIAAHTSDMRVAIALTLASSFTALLLAVTLYALTRDVDRDIAMLGLVCRVSEGVLNGIFMLGKLQLLWLATGSGATALAPGETNALGALLFSGSRVWNTTVGATFFAVGSTAFTWLLLRGRVVPAPLAWIGFVASLLLVVGLPLQMSGTLGSPATDLMWLPMAAFEIPVGVWWLAKGDTTRNRMITDPAT